MAELQSLQDLKPADVAPAAPVHVQKLDSLGKLEADVESVFHGENQAARQNELSKAQTAASFDERRAGAKK